MRRRRTKDSGSESEPVDGSTMVFAGSILEPGEDKGLSVVISKSGGTIVMATKRDELGRWLSTDVTIHAIDTTSFSFVAEGDRLVFIPSEPAVFGASPLVTVEVVEGRRRTRRRTKKKQPDVVESVPVRSEHLPRKQRKVETKDSRSERRSKESAAPIEEPANVPEEPYGGLKHRRWLWFLDVARRNRLFGLDRVPIDETLRGFEHEHSWDHRVATPSGLASHVCTVCGRVRF